MEQIFSMYLEDIIMKNDYLFTSESVSPGHPDKIADQISDAILDEIVAQDPYGRVACETFIKSGMVLVGGEITSRATINFETVARNVIRSIGYKDASMDFSADLCAVLSVVGQQSQDIAEGIRAHESKLQGAGDQGIMFGYACNETPELMPASILYAHRLMKRHAKLLHQGAIKGLRPDAKCQVSIKYIDDKPQEVSTVVLSTQHDPELSLDELRQTVIEMIIKPVVPSHWITRETKFLINPAGRFVLGGPVADCGLTGRKIIVDTYGGAARHGGGCFSGKDPSKVDRSAAYFLRYVAKNIVAAGIADRCEIQIAYAIGVAQPVAINVNTFGTGVISDERIIALMKRYFDFTPTNIIEQLQLLRPIYRKTAIFGHFGREESEFAWENTDKAELLRVEI